MLIGHPPEAVFALVHLFGLEHAIGHMWQRSKEFKSKEFSSSAESVSCSSVMFSWFALLWH
jgi:hypothetical protein